MWDQIQLCLNGLLQGKTKYFYIRYWGVNTSIYVSIHPQGRKRPWRIESQGSQPPRRWTMRTLSLQGLSPIFILSTCMEELGDQHNNIQGNTKNLYKANEGARTAVIKIIKFKGKFLPTPTGGGPLKRQNILRSIPRCPHPHPKISNSWRQAPRTNSGLTKKK